MSAHLAHFSYLIRRKWFFLGYGRRLRVGLREMLVHDLFMFREPFWSLAVMTFHQPSGEEWVQRRAGQLVAQHRKRSKETGSAELEHAQDLALERAKDEHYAHTKEMARIADIFAMHVQHRASYRWEFYVVRDMAHTRYVEMPERRVRAMVADWLAGQRVSGVPKDTIPANTRRWYIHNRDGIRLSPSTRRLVESLLKEIG